MRTTLGAIAGATLLTLTTPLAGAGAAAFDTINGTSRDDRLIGTPGRDRITGFAGNDVLKGRGGRDRLYGDNGADRLFGGPKHDVLYPGRGRDVVEGGRGPDKVVATNDGRRDQIRCGAGNDIVEYHGGSADRRDNLRGCEQVVVYA